MKRSLTTNTFPLGVEVICTLGAKTCAACCFGSSVPRATLELRFRRQRERLEARPPKGEWAFLWHELISRRGADLFLALALRTRWLGARARTWLAHRGICAFVVFLDEAETRVGCWLHPSRFGGRDRRGAAFRLLDGVACGPADYLCEGAQSFERASDASRGRFVRRVARMDWHAYGRAASQFRKGEPPCP